MTERRLELTDEQWTAIAPSLPEPKASSHDEPENVCEKPFYPGASRCTIRLIMARWIIASLLLRSLW